MNSPIHVVVLEDEGLEWRGLTIPWLKDADLLLAVEAHSQSEALELCAAAQPDVVLLDLPNPERDGPEAIRAIGARYPQTRVIVLAAGKPDGTDTTRAVSTLPAAPDAVSADEPTAGSVPAEMAEAAAAPLGRATAEHLTARELEVLGLMAQGLTNTQIAEHLCISRATVKFHVSSILSKLRSPTRTAAVAVAMQRHLASRSPAAA